MKYKLIISLVILVVITSFIGVIQIINSNKQVSFLFTADDFTVNIYSKKGEEITTLSTPETITLRKGDYTYSIVGEGYSAKITPFTVKDSMEIKVTPTYLPGYLKRLSEDEKEKIEAILSKQYSPSGIITISKLEISKTGKWAYGTLSVSTSPDVYRFVMERNEKTWKSAVRPAIALSTEDAPSIPKEILYSLY